jgi:hypothetical protein
MNCDTVQAHTWDNWADQDGVRVIESCLAIAERPNVFFPHILIVDIRGASS